MSETKPLIILGAGGHAKVLIAALRTGPTRILGIVERVGCYKTGDVLGIPIIGDDNSVLRYSPQDVWLVNGLGSVSSTECRRELFEKFVVLGYRFAMVLHAAAVISTDVCLNEGVQVMAGAVLQPGAVVGKNSILNTNASVDHDCWIADHVHIAPGATLSGSIRVGEGTLVGAGAVLIQGIEIGSQCVVAAGSVVIHDVAAHTRVAGIPARIMKRKRAEKQ
ncbi:MAG: acetyltransferase [Terracidiphilus sp.]|nr:acetyltransferase [Terracidiphilus sp.]